MKKLIFLIIIVSIVTAQPQTLKRPLSPKKIPSSQDLHKMVNDQAMNRSVSLLDTETGRQTREERQNWNGSAWVNNLAMDYTYPLSKSNEGQASPLSTIFYWLWSAGVWGQNGYENWTYDAENNLLEVLSYNVFGNPYYRRTYSGPFINGHPTSYVEQWYENGAWVNYYRYWYSFDSNGYVVDELQEWWNGSSW